MKIWIINQYATLPATGGSFRHRYLARGLAAKGHEVAIIAARWTHLTRDEAAAFAAPQVDYFEEFRFVSLDLLRYPYAQSRKRVLNWFWFGYKILSLPRLLDEEPDVIIYSSPAPVGYLAAERLARRYGAQLVFEVRDIWPLTLTEIGGFSQRHPLIRLFQWIEDRAYRSADLVISNLRGAVDHMVKRGLPADRFLWVPNGVALDDAEANETASAILHQWIPRDKFVVGYAGTLGDANSITTLIEAAIILQSDPSIVFVFLGEGKERVALEEIVRRKGLESVIFLGSVPKSQVQDIIARFDVSWVGSKASSLYDYGIAANKIFDYLLAECPVLLSYSGKHDPVRDYGAGLCVPAEDPQALADAILEMRALPAELRRDMGVNGRVGVEKHHDFAKLAELLELHISAESR